MNGGTRPSVSDIAALADEAGLRRIHVLAWRDLVDIEAGGSEVHAAKILSLWAEAGLEVTMRTSDAEGTTLSALGSSQRGMLPRDVMTLGGARRSGDGRRVNDTIHQHRARRCFDDGCRPWRSWAASAGDRICADARQLSARAHRSRPCLAGL